MCVCNPIPRNARSPHSTSPAISWTLCFHRPPCSSSHSFTFRTFAAMDSASFLVSSLPIAANTKRPLPIVEMSWPSTVTEADLTLCMTAGRGNCQITSCAKILRRRHRLTLHSRTRLDRTKCRQADRDRTASSRIRTMSLDGELRQSSGEPWE